jgi:WD40 repeat protein
MHILPPELMQKKQLLQILREHRDEVWFLQFSNNGKYLASASNDKSAIIWKVFFSLAITQSHPLLFVQKK